MNSVKKILIAHADPVFRRRLIMALAVQGFDVRAFSDASAALDGARAEWFDLALLDAAVAGREDLACVRALKRVQLTLPVIMLADPEELELSLIVQGIRAGLADVVEEDGDLFFLIERVYALLRPEAKAVVAAEPTLREWAEVDALLARNAGRAAGPTAPSVPASALEKLVRAQALLEADRADFEAQREGLAATQAVVDEKARALATLREGVARERALLEQARGRVEISPGSTRALSTSPLRDEAACTRDRAEIAQAQALLYEEERRVREESQRLRKDAAQLAAERRRWQEDVQAMREQESNLSAYEARLRAMQDALESDRVALVAQPRPTGSSSPFENAALRGAWEKVQRATELVESERAAFNEERRAVRAHEAALNQREERLAALAIRLADDGTRLQPVAPVATPLDPTLTAGGTKAPVSVERGADGPEGNGRLKALTRVPFVVAKSMWNRGR